MSSAFLVLVWLASVARACSAPDAEAVMATAKWSGWGFLGVTAVIVLGSAWRAKRLGRGTRSMAAGFILLVAHPGIWMPVTGPDCGTERLEGSLLFTGLAAALGLWGVLRAHPEDQPRSEERSPRP